MLFILRERERERAAGPRQRTPNDHHMLCQHMVMCKKQKRLQVALDLAIDDEHDEEGHGIEWTLGASQILEIVLTETCVSISSIARANKLDRRQVRRCFATGALLSYSKVQFLLSRLPAVVKSSSAKPVLIYDRL